MNYGPLIFLGLLFTMTMSWYGIIYKNYLELGRLEPTRNETGQFVEQGRPGFAGVGADVYRSHNCASCHTLQVRASGITSFSSFTKPGLQTNFVYHGADIERGWGQRPTVLHDFLFDSSVYPGLVRIGPDLSNVGARSPDANTQLLHLYNPKITVKDSTMPPYPFLFEKRKVKGISSTEALQLSGDFAPPAGYEIVPTREAKALVAYLQSLRTDYDMFAAPLPMVVTNKQPNAAAEAPAPTANSQK
jgi:cytochrome c oxidase cbb3-type subunit II